MLGGVEVKNIRSQYPRPIRVGELEGDVPGPHDYCVGGAFCQYLVQYAGHDLDPVPFPSVSELAEGLMVANPDLGWHRATEYALMIIYLNDDGRFDTAWSVLEAALNWSST